MPKVSVVLPVRNEAVTIGRAVDSILHQRFEDWELIIVNDGSTDQTKAILSAYDDPRVNVYTIPCSGIARALNFGIRMSKGEYIARMDGDDVCHPNRFLEQVCFLDKYPKTGLVSSLVVYEGDRKSQLGYALYVDMINSIINETDILKKRFSESPFAHPSVMFRKSLFYQYGGYSEGPIPEDFELWLRWLDQGVVMNKVSKTLLTWHDRSDRLSRVHEHYTVDRFFEVKAYYFKKWLYQNFDEVPELWIFGAGKEVNHRARHFAQAGLKPSRFIDIKHHKDHSRFIYYKDIPRSSGKLIILSLVSDREGKTRIMEYLNDLGYTEGSTFFMMA